MKAPGFLFSALMLISVTLKAQEQGDTLAIPRAQRLAALATVTPQAIITQPDYILGYINGDVQFHAVYKNDPSGIGDHLFRIWNKAGRVFSVGSYNTLSNQLITDIGVNYSIDGVNGYQRYVPNGAKKSAFIRLNAEDGSVSLFGESGTGADWRSPVTNLGVYVKNTGAVGIGTTAIPSDAKFAVNGKMYARDVIVNVSAWSDFVFDKDYSLLPLADVEKFIECNRHLPGVPSEAEVKEKGISVSDMNAVLLKKIEELTLYMIEMKKGNEELKSKIEQFSK